MPADFKEKFPTTRVIIDCTEVRCEMPSSLLLNSELFSSYKNHVTLKGLVGIAPSGAIPFITLVVSHNRKLLFEVASCHRNLRMVTLLWPTKDFKLQTFCHLE